MAIPLYTQRTLINVINDPKLEVPPRFFRSMFFPSGQSIGTEYVEIQKFSQENGMSGFVYVDDEADVVGKPTGTGKIYQAPIIREKTPWSAKELLEIEQGDQVLRIGGETKESARQRKIKETLARLKNRILNREEWLCINTLKGGWTYTGHDKTVSIDFEFAASHTPTLVGTAKWGEADDDIKGNLEAWFDLISETVGGGILAVVLGRNAARKFKADADIRADLKDINVKAGTLDLAWDKQLISNYMNTSFYQITEKVRVAGVQTDLLPPNVVVIIGDAMETDFRYGQITQMNESGAFAANIPIFSKQYVKGDDVQTLWTMVESRPFPIITNPGSVVWAVVMD